MACPNNLVFFIFTILFLLELSDTVHHKNEEHLNDHKNEEDALQYQRHKANDHLSTLSPNPNTWVDPYEMLKIPARSQEDLFETTDENFDLNSNYPILEADDQPLFSDVDGNVIVEKVHNPPHRNVINDLDAGGFYEKDQQQICVLDSIYISRWLKKLIFKIENESNLEASAVSFQIDSIVLDNLKKISAAKSFDITELDILICDMLSQMVVISKIESYDWKILENCYDVVWVIVYVMSIGFILYGLLCSFKQHPKIMIFVCVLFIFVLWHWICLNQHIKAYNRAELSSIYTPDECKMYNFGLFEHVREYIIGYFFKNECNKYFEPFMVDPLLEMSLNVTVFEAIKTVILLPFTTPLKINGDRTRVHDNWLIYMLLFLVMFLLIMGYLCGIKQFSRDAFLLISKIFKTPSSIQSTCGNTSLKQNSDEYANHSDSLNGQNKSSNSNRFPFSSIGTNSTLSGVPENSSDPELSCDSCDANDQSCSEDDDSYPYSDNGSWSDNSCDSQDCPCCIHDSELIQELHVGCRVCDNNNAIAGSAGTSRDDSESLFKNEMADSADQQASVQPRSQRLHKGETACADSSESSPQPIIDPSAG